MKQLLVIGVSVLFLGAACDAARAGADAPKEEKVQALIKALKDPDPEVRARAADDLGMLGPDAETAVPALVQALKDPHESVRHSAAWALPRLGPKAIPPLVEALGDKDET